MAGLHGSTVGTAQLLLHFLGVDYAKHKLKDVATCAAVLGVEVALGNLSGGRILVKNKTTRLDEILSSLNTVLESGKLSARDASKLLCIFQYADSFTMSRDGRIVMSDLRQGVRSDGWNIQISLLFAVVLTII